MGSLTSLDYYRQQSCFSDSDKLVDLFKDLPDDLSELCRIVRGIYVHYQAKNLPTTVHERLKEADSRYLSRILDRIVTLDSSGLAVARPLERRFIGCCRDASLLLCSMLRHKGIPARIRVGFAAYIPAEAPFSYTDHVITEYWNTDSGRWQMVDSEQDETLINQKRIDFDVHDIPQDKFVTGGRAWLMGRENAHLWEAFGINDFVKGRWFVAGYLIRDFAALNRDEVLLWDSWGLMKSMDNLSIDDLELLDRVAKLTTTQSADLDAIQTLYTTEPRLKLPQNVMVYSPVSEWREEQISCIQ